MSAMNSNRGGPIRVAGMSTGGVLGILIGLLVGILIGLLVFTPPSLALGAFDGGGAAAFLAQYCPSLTGGAGELLPAVNQPGAGELLPAVNKTGEDGGLSACMGIFNLSLGGDARLMSFFACQGSFRRSVGLPPVGFDTMCASALSASNLCLTACDPNVANACGDSGLVCTKENGAYFCDGALCQQGQYGGKCDEKCDPSVANACQPGLDCKPAGDTFTCQGASCSQPVVTQPVSTEPANPNNQPDPQCTPNPNDGICSACENTDLDSNACVCNMDGVCGPGEGLNCGDCQAPSGDDGGKAGKNNGGNNQCQCINGVDSCNPNKKC